MKKYKKTYAISTLAEKHTTFHLGKTKVHVSFTGGQVTKNGVNPATFTTADPIVQLAIERSSDFAKGAIVLLAKYPMQGEVKIGKNPPEAEEAPTLESATPKTDLIMEAATPVSDKDATVSPDPTPKTLAEKRKVTLGEEPREEAVAATTEAKPDTEETTESNLEVVEVSCSDVAKQYLQEHFGEKPAPLRRIADIQECAAKYGITFNFV